MDQACGLIDAKIETAEAEPLACLAHNLCKLFPRQVGHVVTLPLGLELLRQPLVHELGQTPPGLAQTLATRPRCLISQID